MYSKLSDNEASEAGYRFYTRTRQSLPLASYNPTMIRLDGVRQWSRVFRDLGIG